MPHFAIADTSSGAASLLNGLNNAANQQAQLQRQMGNAQAAQAQQGLKDEMEAFNQGWIPVAGPGDTGNQPGYVTKDPGASPSTPGNTMPVLKGEPSHYQTDAPAPGAMSNGPDGTQYGQQPAPAAAPSGRYTSRMKQINGSWYYYPTDQEKGKNFIPSGQLGDALKTAGWDGKTPVTPEQSHSVMQALNEAQPKDEPYEYDASGKYLDAKTGKPVPGFIGKKSKKFFPVDLSGGDSQSSTPGAAPGGPFDTSAQPNPGWAYNQRDLEGMGAIPVDTVAGPGNSSGFTTRTPNPAAHGAGRTIRATDTGNSYFFPSAQPNAQASHGAAPGGPFDMSDDPGQPGQSTPQQANGAAPNGPFSFAPPEKADKPDASQIVPGMQGPNGGPLIYDKTSQSMKEIPPVPGSKGVLTADQQDKSNDRKLAQSRLAEDTATRLSNADQAKAERAAKIDEQYARTHEAEGNKKESMQSMAQGYWDAAKTAPDETYFPPRYVNGIVVPGPATRMPPKGPEYDARQADLGTTAKAFEKTAATHQAAQERIEKTRGWGKFAAPQTTPQAPSQAPAQKPAQRTAAPAAQPAPAPAKQVAQQLPTGHKKGDTVKLKNGNTVKIKQVYADGSFDY